MKGYRISKGADGTSVSFRALGKRAGFPPSSPFSMREVSEKLRLETIEEVSSAEPELTASLELPHTLASRRFTPERRSDGVFEFFRFELSGEFRVLHPGKLVRRAPASHTRRFRVALDDSALPDEQRPGTAPLHGGFETVRKTIPGTFHIFTPDGREFTAPEVTRADLDRFRDSRGAPSGNWSYRVTGEGEHFPIDEDSSLGNPTGSLGITLVETVPSDSAPPLVDRAPVGTAPQSFPFDLYRVGRFLARARFRSFFDRLTGPWRGSMALFDPDGVAVARSANSELAFEVGLATLAKSRDAQGRARPWRLEVSGANEPRRSHVSATVIGSGRITVAALTARIDALLGPRGSFIKVFGDNAGGDALARLMVTDAVSAETIDMHGLLDDVLSGVVQDDGANPRDFEANTVYTLARRSEDLAAGVSLDVSSLKLESVDVAIGPGVRLGAAVPTIRLTLAVSGAVKAKFLGQTLATARLRGGKCDIEVGMTLARDGTPRIVTEVPSSPFDIDISRAVLAVLNVALGPFGSLAGLSVTEYLEREINQKIAAGARELFSDPALAPRMLMTIFGAHLAYKVPRVEGDAILFEHTAPIEPEPKPTPGYQGAIGRSISQPSPLTFSPPSLGDTWAAGNLQKIDHIVVVMMENRSYDHVLGYRALPPTSDGADGWSEALIQALEQSEGKPFDIRGLRAAGFPRNDAQLMTRLPKAVGHEVSDVRQQLSVKMLGPDGRMLNGPQGFVDNFRAKLGGDPRGVIPDDVLGYYDDRDLPFYAFLASQYSYSDRYYCSHPGPTLPNRMYSLTGDLQHDRYGFPILDNNDGDNFLLSRAPTIYDVLARHGLSFRVYESLPSVTMLRMFARYATDTTHIVPLDRLAADVARGDLPCLTAIEPQMHAHPQDDDHPDADMLQGQQFLKRVYDTLSSNRALWEKTLLVITYDEHGGLYDHVVPPSADVYTSTNGGPALLTVPYGLRVPTFVVSPWAARGKGPSLTLDHCSLLKTVLARFLGQQRPFLSDRVSASQSFDAFLSAAAPRLDVPASPVLPSLPIEARLAPPLNTRIITPPLSRQAMRQGPVDYHQLSGRWARQLGR